MSHLQRSDLERRVAEGLERGWHRRQQAIDPRALCWLALLPEWTEELAEACRFPHPDGDLRALVARAAEQGLCTVRSGETPGGQPTIRFWMPTEVRSRLFEQWQLGSSPNLRPEILKVASAITSLLGSDKAQISPAIQRWSELALGELQVERVTGGMLAAEVDRALAAEDATAAAEWIVAGDHLAFPLGAEVELAASRARRRLDLHYRQIQDKRSLAEFVRREEQIKEIRRLISSDREWMVHFIGQSGVGKTMLMRYLTGRLPDADPVTFSTRIDFDYIDPRFPLEAPARLLQALGEGLEANLENADQESQYLIFREAVTRAEAADVDPGRPLETDEFKLVVKTFAGFVETLPKPVVLILDTCEELAKLYPAGEDVPSIRAMFDILDMVHAEAPEVRFVLAGRRWLTKKAANRPPRLTMPPAVAQMEPRLHMRMHDVRGFTKSEAIEYLRQIRKLPLDDELLKAVLKNTEDEGQAASWNEGLAEPEEETRYSPTDLALFAGWLEREPKLKAADLAGSNLDPYVEVRIFDRIQSSLVVAAIPAATLLGRFDAETIGPALAGDARAQAKAVEGLIEQEWTHLEARPGSQGMVISVDSRLQRRLEEYYRRSPDRERELEEARERLIPHLSQMFDRPTVDVPPDRIDSAVRALPIEKSLELLELTAQRVVREPAWPWAEAVGRFLLSRERRPLLPEPLRAPVRALYVAALSHRRSGADFAKLWKAVEEEAADHPDSEKALALELRAELGWLRAEASSGVDPRKARGALAALDYEVVAEEVAPALLATVEAIADAREADLRPMPVQMLQRALAGLLRHYEGNASIHPYLLSLQGRVRALIGDWGGARESFSRLEKADLPPPGPPPGFADWIPPESIRQRTLLELLRFRLAAGSEDEVLLNLCERVGLDGRNGADGGQLVSLALQARLASGELQDFRLLEIEQLERSLGGYDLTAPAHAVAPPLFVSLAETWEALGERDQAMALLVEREDLAAARRTEEGSAVAAAVAAVRILRTVRSPERLGLIAGLLSGRERAAQAEALSAAALIAGMRPPSSSRFDSGHAAWRARNMLNPRFEHEALQVKRGARHSARGEEAVHLALDRFEAELVQRRLSGLRGLRFMRAARAAATAVEDRRGARSILRPLGKESLRLDLRESAITGKKTMPVEPRRMRQVGRLALEEGELLALRLPHRAIPMLDHAEKCLDQAGACEESFFAALRGAIAEVHAGKPDQARGRRKDLLARYERIRARLDALPAPEQLSRETAAHDHFWTEWCRRFGAYLQWCEDPAAGSKGVAIEWRPELALKPCVGAPGSPATTPLGGTEWRLLAALVGALAILSSGALFGGATPSDLLLGLATMIVLVLFMGTAGGRLARLVPRTILPVMGYDVTISPAPRWPRPGEMARAVVEPRTRGWLVRSYFRVWRRVRLNARWETLVSTRSEVGDRRPPGALGLVVRPTVSREYTPVRLVVSPDLASVPWEWRLVAHLAREKGWDPSMMPEILRVRAQRSEGGLVHLPPRLAAVCSPQRRPIVESVSPPGVKWTMSSSAPAGAAVALGLPVMTRAGWRLRLDDALAEAVDDPSGPQVQQLHSPDRLARRAPIAIVVGRPGGWRRSSEQDPADGLRGFANEVFLAGARAVIVVPPLPSEMAAAAIGLLAGEFNTWAQSPEPRVLLNTVALLRRQIYHRLCETGKGDEVDEGEERRLRAAQLALDVCLFVRDR